MEYHIYTFGNGAILKGLFDALVACLNAESGTLYAPLIRLSLIIGGLWAALYALYGDFMRAITHWILPMTIIMQLLFVPQASVWIHDPVSHHHQKVDKVPYGLAMMAGTISKIGYGLTEQVEKIFRLPNDLKYQKTGTLFASNLIQQAKTFHITNEAFSENMRQFVGQCVAYDVLLGQKYTLHDLRHSPDIWALVSKQPSPVRSFLWRDLRPANEVPARARIITCAEGVKHFNALWPEEVNKTASVFGKKIFGKATINVQTELLNHLKLAYNTLGEMASGAEDLLKQNMMIYAVVDGLEQKSTSLGNAPNFALRRAYLQQRASYETLGALAAETLPSMKAVLEAISYAAFLFIIPLAILPFGFRFLSSWLQTLLWLQMWAPLYAVLNYIMTMAAKAKSLAALSVSDGRGVTIASSLGLANVNADMAAMVGYLALSIPFLCIAMVRGLGSFVQMASQLSQVSQSAGSQAAQDLVSGNYSFGNVGVGARQFANTSMLNQSYGASYRSGSFHQSNGRRDITTSSDGQKIVNIATSNIPIQLNVAESVSAQKSEQANKSYHKGLTASVSSVSAMSDAFKTIVDFSNHLGKNTQLNKSTGAGRTIDHTEGLSRMGQIIKDFAFNNQMSEQRSAKILAAAAFSTKNIGGGNLNSSKPVQEQSNVAAANEPLNSVEAETGVNASAITDGNMLPVASKPLKSTDVQEGVPHNDKGAPASNNANQNKKGSMLRGGKQLLSLLGINLEASGSLTGSASKQDIYSKAEKVVESGEFQEAFRKTEQTFKNKLFGELNEEGKRLVENIHQSWDESLANRIEAAKHFREFDDYNKQASHIKNTAATVNANYNQPYLDWLSRQPADKAGGGPLGLEGAADMIADNPQGATQYAQQFLAEKGLEPQRPKEIPIDPKAKALQDYAQESRYAFFELNKENTLKNMEALKAKAASEGLFPVDDEGLKAHFKEQERALKNQRATQEQFFHKKWEETAEKHEKQSRKSLLFVAPKQQALHVWDSVTHGYDLVTGAYKSVSDFFKNFGKGDKENDP